MKLPPLTPEQAKIYDRTTCQKCKKFVSKKRINNCKKRRYFPVCEECEKIITPKLKKAMEFFAKMKKGGF